MAYYTSTKEESNQGFTHVYSGVSESELSQLVEENLMARGYQRNDGEAGNGTYSKGSRTMRILFGAFVKYYKWRLYTDGSGEETKVTLDRATSGMSGGAIGVKQVKTELKQLSEQLRSI